jgi:hypothetical protein
MEAITMAKLHNPHATTKQQSPGVDPEVKTWSQGNDKSCSIRSNWLQNSSLSKSMPHHVKQDFTAEDDSVSSLRTFRYLKLEPTDTMELPPPRKFANFTTQKGRLTRSKSAQEFGTRADSLSRPAHINGAQGHAHDASSSARLRESLFMDEFQLLRPPSFVVMLDSHMSNPADEAGGDEIVDAHAKMSNLHFLDDTHGSAMISATS